MDKRCRDVCHRFSNYAFCRWLAEEGTRQAQARANAEAARQQAGQGAILLDDHQALILLRLPESSPPTRIKEAYRQLALKHHPDLGSAHLAMVALNRAYELDLCHAKGTSAA